MLPAFALAKADPTTALNELQSVLTRYREAKSIKTKVKKTVVQDLLGSETESRGNFYFSRGRLRLDILSPEKSILVYDGTHVWLESRIDKTIAVTKIAAGQLKKSDSLLAALFEKKDILQSFKLLENKNVNGSQVFAFEPKDKKKSEVQYLELKIKEADLKKIMFKDQVENRVSFEFGKIKISEVSEQKFTYKPPKGASVTEIK